MARPSHIAQHHRHTLQLLTRLLNTRPGTSPFTLILDSLHQRAAPLTTEITRRALARSVPVILLSYETTRVHPSLTTIPAYSLSSDALTTSLRTALSHIGKGKEALVLIDSLDSLRAAGADISSIFGIVAGEFGASLVGVYHADMLPSSSSSSANAYAPPDLELLRYMATAILNVRSFAHVLEAREAARRARAEPVHGLLEGAEGVVVSRSANDARGVVVEAEFRRKSGRDESAVFFLRAPRESDYGVPVAGAPFGAVKAEFGVLLEQVPEFAEGEKEQGDGEGEVESTFNLGLTDKQKAAREGVVLPYFDAQKGEGAGEGGRILYDMGEEDDFDEEEDEI